LYESANELNKDLKRVTGASTMTVVLLEKGIDGISKSEDS